MNDIIDEALSEEALTKFFIQREIQQRNCTHDLIYSIFGSVCTKCHKLIENQINPLEDNTYEK